MKKVVILLISVCLFIASANATHNRAGYIAYTHISGLTYEVEITTYTVPGSPADRPYLALNWGDGELDTIPRTNGNGNGVLISATTKENKYISQHTYPTIGDYVLSLEDPNRNAGIQNIPNSVNIPFYVDSELNATLFNGMNSSARTSGLLNFNGYVGLPLVQNLAFYDPDADFLSFALVTPKGENGMPIDGYTIPQGVSVNPSNGDFVWEMPEETGEFGFAMQVNEFRNTELIGTVVLDFQVVILAEGDSIVGNVFGINAWPTNGLGDHVITVEPNETVELMIGYSDMEADSISQTAYGEPFFNGNTAQFHSDSASSTYLENTFEWTPTSTEVRCAPYIVGFRSSLSATEATDVSLLIYVHDQSITSNPECLVFAGYEEEGLQEDSRINFYPNPFTEVAAVSFSTENVFDFTFEVFNASGQLVYSEYGSTQSPVQLNADFGAGLYFYKARFSDGKIEQGKVVVQ